MTFRTRPQFREEDHPRKGGKFVSKGGVERSEGKVRIRQSIQEERRRLYQEMSESQRRDLVQALIQLHREQNQPRPQPEETHTTSKKGSKALPTGSVTERLEHLKNQVGPDAAFHIIQKLSVERLSHEQLGHLAEVWNKYAANPKRQYQGVGQILANFRKSKAFNALGIPEREIRATPRLLHPVDYTAPKKFGC